MTATIPAEVTVETAPGLLCPDCAGRGFQPTGRLRPRTCPRCCGTGDGPAARFDAGTCVLTIPSMRAGATCRYRVTEVDAGWFDGRVFQLDKLDAGSDPEEPTGYVCGVGRNGQDHSCYCKGFVAHGRDRDGTVRPCKHLADLLGLLHAGASNAPPARAGEPVAADPFA